MEILIGITPLIVFILFSVIISIQDWIIDMQFYRRRTQRELNRIRRSLGEVEYAKTTLPTGEIDILGPGKVLIFDKQKVGTVTGTSLRSNEELEELNEAERLIKEAHDRAVD